jgi:hypothetical protein
MALDPGNKILTTWSDKTWPCGGTWLGVQCDTSGTGGRVTSIVGSSFVSMATGSLPKQFSVLAKLDTVELKSLSLLGSLPAEWSTLTRMYEL